ncbi:uncharacterized protein LOC105437686 [Strongylocentrotus purpuratus]|uniref:Uncharacterized protein n=1 Tax=Strongylocentrotus purpuratus TaxID=7668 RepID=A0A7M7PIQ1_STRPU|nr:uncharacterized protein LOC105437686 [Strongylocentrotus purpuratus]
MPVSLGEWRVRIGTFMRRRRKEYDYHYFWRKLHNLIKRNKNAEQPREDNNPECNISSRTGSSSDAKRSPSNTARQSASSCNANLNINQTGPSCDVNNDRGNANSPTLSQFDVPECNTKCGSPCDSNNPGHNDVSHSEYPSAENSGSSIEKKTNPVLDTTEVKIPVLQPCVEDELDNRNISISLMSYEYTPKSDQISKKDKPKVGTSESYSDVPGEIGRIKLDEEETSDSRPSGKEDQTTDLSPKPRIHTTRNTDQRTSSIREVTENHGSPTYPIPLSGTSIGEADAIKGNDCPDMATILLLRSGDVERNPGPNNNPGSLGELELYLLADGIDPSDFRKVGLALGFPEAKLSQFEKDKLGNSMQATYQMLYEWRKTVPESEAREILVNKLESIKLVQLADSVRKGQVGDHIPSMTEEEIQRVAEEVKHYLAIHICQIQVDPLNNEVVLEFKRIFTNLTLMKEDKGSKLNTPLLYDDLLRTKVNGIYPKRLLVEGEGGVGKTTFCAKIAWDWIHGIGYQDFKLVLVILLREAGAKTVGEIVKSYLSDNNPVTAKQLDKHILSNSDDVFLVLDGLDEFAVDLDSNQQIALITLYRLFKSGTVLITSRQWRSDEIRKNDYLRREFAFIAVEGFSAENLSSYITKFFHPDTASSENLCQFISNNDVIGENMAPYPIYTAMLCIMWKEFDGERREAMSMLQTFSQLFNQMIEFLVDHYLSKHIPSSGIDEGKLRENRSDIRDHLLQIGRIAFQGLLLRQLVFTEEEFQRCPESIDVGCKVGVLTREKKVLPRRERRNDRNLAVQSVQFPHKLFQEYLSGMYLAYLYNSNRNKYDRLIANIIPEADEYRYLLYITSAQQKGVGLDIVSRLIAASQTNNPYDDDFIVDVAYESQDQAVAKVVADHLSTTVTSRKCASRKTLEITKKMQAHTVSGHIFIMNQREVDHLSIEKPCGRTASEDQAEFICSSRSPKSVTIASTMHDIFYSVLANKAGDSKIETLNIYSLDLSKRPSASRDLAQFICKMPHLERLSHGKQGCSEYRLNVLLHDDFYSTSSSIASSTKIETLDIKSLDLSERPSASRDLAQFICKMPHLKYLFLGKEDNPDCGPKVCLHDDFYSTSSSIASSAKVSI